MVAIGCIELGEKGVCGPFSEAVGDVLAVAGVVWKGSVEVADNVWKVECVRLRRRKVLIEEYGGCDVGGFFSDGERVAVNEDGGMFSLLESVSEAVMCFVGFEKTLGIL